MSTRLDIEMKFPGNLQDGFFDISINSTGDITADESFDTQIFASLFSDRRADGSQITPPELRRGWNGDVNATLEGYLFGSLLWLLEQERLRLSIVAKAQDFAQSSLQWIIDLEFATRVDVTATRNFNSEIQLDIVIFVKKDIVATFTTTLWLNSRFGV